MARKWGDPWDYTQAMEVVRELKRLPPAEITADKTFLAIYRVCIEHVLKHLEKAQEYAQREHDNDYAEVIKKQREEGIVWPRLSAPRKKGRDEP